MTREGGRVVRVNVAAPRDPTVRPLAGEGWQLELKPGWTIVAAARPGDFVVKQQAESGGQKP